MFKSYTNPSKLEVFEYLFIYAGDCFNTSEKQFFAKWLKFLASNKRLQVQTLQEANNEHL